MQPKNKMKTKKQILKKLAAAESWLEILVEEMDGSTDEVAKAKSEIEIKVLKWVLTDHDLDTDYI